MVEHSRLSSTILEYHRFCPLQRLNIHSIWILSIYTGVITRTGDPYLVVHLVYHGNLWQIQSDNPSLYSKIYLLKVISGIDSLP